MLKSLTKMTFIVMLVFLLTGFNDPATVVSFSADKLQFMEELKTFIEATKKEEYILLYKDFEGQVKDNQFSEPEFGEIVGTCNKMGEKKMTASPYFTEYLKGLNVVKSTDAGQNNFMDWHETLQSFLENLKTAEYRHYKTYLLFSQNLFKGEELIKAKGGIEWAAETASPLILWQNGEPVVKYLKTDLVAVRKNVSLHIKGTSGMYFPMQNKWVGDGGVISWSRISDNINAEVELSTYEINMDKGEYTAENAKLSYPKFFGERKVVGQFKDKLLASSGSVEPSYPRFQSRKESVTITGLGEGLVYTGGFSMEGVKVEGSADENEVCSLVHSNKMGEKTFRLAGQHFSLKDEEFINAKNVEAVIYMGQDSIFHPNIDSKFEVKNTILTLRTGDKAISKSPFYDSYHQVYINTDKLNWYPKENKLMINETRLKTGAGSQTVTIESQDFYSEKYIRRIQNVADYNPIVKLMQLAEQEGQVIPVDVVAQYFNPNFEVANIQTLLFDLEENGFIQYLPKEKIVKVFDKVLRYGEVHAGKRDFDVLKIKSEIGGGNATLDLEKNELAVKGVKQMEFSSRQKVAALPSNKEINIVGNRNIDFDGDLFAGFATMQGTGFHFDYEKFFVQADSVRYLDFYLPDAANGGEAFALGSRIENVTGTVLIDAPANKSGREDLTIFPSFKSKGASYVYYDQQNKLGDVYNRDSFYFELKPFFLDELRQLTPQHFELKGKMVTADIFPEFEETLRYQSHDHSLGFVTKAPAEGYTVFKEKGKFQGDLALSNSGLRGKGSLNYEKTAIESEDMVFRPNSLNCSAKSFDLEKDVTAGIPKVEGVDVTINWLPYQDSMYVVSKEKSFNIFTETEHTVAGMLIYTPGGLKGKGEFQWKEGQMDADLFNFGHYSVQSENTDLQIKALETDALAFDTKNVSGSMDFEKQSGNFKSNDKDAITKMPHNQYETTLNEFEWNLGEKNLTFVADENKLGVFTSTDNKQKELSFEAATGQYDFTTSQLKVGGVPYIAAADAHIFPDEGKVTIEAGGKMQVLKNASVLASTTNKYHEIKRATIEVHSKEKYTGSGFYEYNVGNVEQEIPFRSIVGQRVGKKTDNKIETVAEAVVGKETPFVIGKGFLYEGNIELRSSNPDLAYHGFAKFETEALNNPRWFSIKCRADKNDLHLVLDTPEDKEEQHVEAGVFIDKENNQNYARLLMPLRSRKDHAFINATGMVKYDATNSRIIIGDSLKVMNANSKGNLMIFNEKDASIKAMGTINMLPNLKGAGVKIAGVLTTGLPSEELKEEALANEKLTAKVAAAIQFGLPKDLTSIITTDFSSASFEAKTIVYDAIEMYSTVLPELISDAKKVPESMQQLTKGNSFMIPNEDCDFSFLLTELEMTWDADYQSFISNKSEIGLAALGTKGYHKMIKGAVEFKTPLNGEDQVSLLLTSPGGNYYFFSYKNGILVTYSSYAEYNAEVEGMKSNARTVKLDSGTFEIQLATPEMVSNFRNRTQS